MMSRPRLLVIDPAIRTPAQAACAQLAQLVGEAQLTIVCPALTAGADAILEGLPLSEIAGIIILGSAASVHDDAAWLRHLKHWLRPVLRAGNVPVLGICFGHQVLADVLGGVVAQLFPQPIKGIRTMTLDATALPWWPQRSATVSLFHSHGDAVVTIPPAARVLAASPIVLPSGERVQLVEALAYDGLPVWSFQPHPETTEAFLSEQGCAALLDTPQASVFLRDGWEIVAGFVRFCLAVAPAPLVA
jgi:GMP synthase-like glutamine amidotransferase